MNRLLVQHLPLLELGEIVLNFRWSFITFVKSENR